MKGKKIIAGFIMTLMILFAVNVKASAANRIIYKITPSGEDSFKITLGWSNQESGNIQITAMMKENDNSVAVYYRANGTEDVRVMTADMSDLGMNLTLNKPNVILRNAQGAMNTLSDMPNDEEMKRAIQNLYSQGVINGYEDGTFKPYSQITKEEFSSMFLGYMDYKLDNSMQSIFSDVTNDRWSKNIIMTLYQKGVITGQDDGAFGWAKNVTLGEVSTMVARAKNLVNTTGQISFTHTRTNHWANDYISKMFTNGLIKSTDNFYYNGSQNLNLTRGQVAVILNRS